MKSPFALFAATLAVLGGAARAEAATLVYTNDILGEIEPCGCRSNPTGGLHRMHNFLGKLQDKDLLQLDAGDLLFPTDSIPEPLVKQSELQAGYLLKGLTMMGQDAAVPGEKDFALGVAGFERLAKEAGFPFLAANLSRKGKPFLEPYRIFKMNGLRVAVLGLVGEDLKWPDELETAPALKTAKALVPKLRGQADLVIALTHQGYEKDVELAEKVTGIDAIVGAHSQSFLQKPVKIGSTEIFQSSFRNQSVGTVPLTKDFKAEGHALVALDAGYDSPEGQPTKMDALVAEFKAKVAELNTQEDAKLERAGGTPGAPKFHTFPKCAECHLKQFDFWRKTAHANALEPLVVQGQARNRECLGCHTVGLDDPEGFSSVLRLAELREASNGSTTFLTDDLARFLNDMHSSKTLDSQVKLRRSDKNPLPLTRAIAQLERSWTPVQCENCHKPGGDHPFSGGYTKAVERETCLKCHTAERAPEWWTGKKPNWKIIDAKRAKIRCPAGSMQPTD